MSYVADSPKKYLRVSAVSIQTRRYHTRMSQCMFSAQGTFSCPNAVANAAASIKQHVPGKEGFRPAWVDEDAKKAAWTERSAPGFPLAATEWQDGGHESHGWVAEGGREMFGSRGASSGAGGSCSSGSQCKSGKCVRGRCA